MNTQHEGADCRNEPRPLPYGDGDPHEPVRYVRNKASGVEYVYSPMPEGCIAGWISEEA